MTALQFGLTTDEHEFTRILAAKRHKQRKRWGEAPAAPFSQPSTYLTCKTHCPKPPCDVISLRHEIKADGTPITESARCGFGKKPKRPEPKFNQNYFA
jgi:hypothetical protein